MNKLLIVSLIFALSAMNIFAENSIKLTINHKIGNENFALNKSGTNNLQDEFKYTRVQYYISGFSFVHDGSMETSIGYHWELINASMKTEIDFSPLDITNVEAVVFHIGVDKDHNNLDPATYPDYHPLAPKLPSMHWGWSAGYRFVCIEGTSGTNNTQFQLHGLGNDNYLRVVVPVTKSASNGIIELSLDADYSRAIENIQVSKGIIVHAEDQEAKQCIENFKDFVFNSSNSTSDIEIYTEIRGEVAVFPNPSIDGEFSIANLQLNDNLKITDVTGNEVTSQLHYGNGSVNIILLDRGIYFLSILRDGRLIATKKLVRI